MTNLFLKEIPVFSINKNSQDEIECLKIKFPNFDEYYIVSAAVKERRDNFEDLWRSYEPYADRNFIKQAQKRFHQKTWEMYLGVSFLKNGLFLEMAGKNAPDIKIINSGKPIIWVECVAPEKGNKADRVHGMIYGVAQNVPQEQIILRIASGFEIKSKQFEKYIESGIVKKDEPKVVAINGADLSYMDGDPAWIIRVLFAIGHLMLRFDKDHKKVIETFYSRIDKIIKKCGSEVSLGQFLSDQYKHISAVIYSHDNVLNRPEHIGTECVIVHNPFAEVPLPQNIFYFMTKYIAEGNNVYKVNARKK